MTAVADNVASVKEIRAFEKVVKTFSEPLKKAHLLAPKA